MNFLHDVIRKQVHNNPDKICAIHDSKKITYTNLWGKIVLLKNWLLKEFIHQDRIGIMLDNSLETIYCLYGISSAGMICVPLDTNIHQKNLSYIISDCKLSLIVTSSKYLTKLLNIKNDLNIKILVTDANKADTHNIFSLLNVFLQFDKKEDDINDLRIISENKELIACILYTTGTTGPKKGVMLSHGNLLSATKNINQFIQIDSWAVESLPMPLSHSFGFARLRCVFDVGGTVILENGFLRPERVIENMRINNTNAISSVPAGFAILLDHYFEQFQDISQYIKYIEIGSAFMRQKHKEMLMELCSNARICMHYGLTEASRSTFIEFHSDKDKLYTVGKPSPNVDVKIIDKNGVDLKLNETGEILVKGEMVMQGYWNKEKMTNESLTDGWLHTGDLGLVDSDGYVHLLGRKKEIINIGGLKVAPGEVEEVLLKYDGIVEAAVIGIKSSDNISDETIKAFVVTDKSTLQIKHVEKYCLENLEPYKVPAQFEIVDSLPKTNSGKIQKHLLIHE